MRRKGVLVIRTERDELPGGDLTIEGAKLILLGLARTGGNYLDQSFVKRGLEDMHTKNGRGIYVASTVLSYAIESIDESVLPRTFEGFGSGGRNDVKYYRIRIPRDVFGEGYANIPLDIWAKLARNRNNKYIEPYGTFKDRVEDSRFER